MTSYHALDDQSVVEYLRSHLADFFDASATLTASEVGDGNLNQVFIVRNNDNPQQALVVKQALPYLRVAGASWPLTRERVRFESQALLLYNEVTPGLAPKVYRYDDEMSVLVIEFLSQHEVMRKPLVKRVRFPQFAEQISTFLAQVLFKTSDLYLSGLEKKTLQAKYINPHLCKIQEDFVYTNPYMESPENQWNPEIDGEVRAVRANSALKIAIGEMKESYMTQAQALIHSDLHTGSIMANQSETRVIDPEFSFFGPMGYDIGALFANLILNYVSHYAHTADADARAEYQRYLLGLIRDIWSLFAGKFEALWLEQNTGELVPNGYWQYPGGDAAFAQYRANYLLKLLQDTAGHGASEMLRRMMGIVSVWDITSIEDMQQRAVAERYAIRIGSRWVTERRRITRIEDLLGIVEEETGNHAASF
ncbi:MAG: S-methyl-5-thioribose kinase [Chloroflexota bacterium]